MKIFFYIGLWLAWLALLFFGAGMLEALSIPTDHFLFQDEKYLFLTGILFFVSFLLLTLDYKKAS